VKIHGDYHMHTTYSDGRASVMEMVQTAKERGLKEIAITDHGVGKITKTLRKSGLEKQIGEIESARSEMPVLVGVEANIISTTGCIDVSDEMREKLDIVLCGVHVLVFFSLRAFFGFCLPNLFWRLIRFTPKFQKRYNTQIVVRAIEKNHIDILTHPNKYFKLDVVEVAKACAERGTLIELSSQKISFRPIDFERMQAVGAKFIINSDSHSTKRVGDTIRVEEFLKHCDYKHSAIINLHKTFTQYRTEKENPDHDITERDKERDSKPKTGFFKRWF